MVWVAGLAGVTATGFWPLAGAAVVVATWRGTLIGSTITGTWRVFCRRNLGRYGCGLLTRRFLTISGTGTGYRRSRVLRRAGRQTCWSWRRGGPGCRICRGLTFYVGGQVPRPGLVKVADSVSGLQAFANPVALPRVWAVRRTRAVGSRGEVTSLVAEGAVVPAREALLVGGGRRRWPSAAGLMRCGWSCPTGRIVWGLR
jgi:hypothetical protein